MILIAAAGSALAALVVAVGAFALTRDDDGDVDGPAIAGALRDAGCTVQTFKAQNRDHKEEDELQDFKYNSDPPTSGPHYGITAPFDFYSDPVEQFRLVHNLEHGGVAIQYGDEVSDETVEEIRDWYLEDPNGIVVAPYPRLGKTIALAAWTAPTKAKDDRYGAGHLAKCPRFDEDAFDAFLDEYAFKGPEPFPREALAPGM